ncbi:DegT/DnrJ/EryC1/StrS family aminotransferase [Bacteroides sp. UBA939]|uniref:DegT/DnrJ/EryC1/StrS family aminotransferase n=1 Tax=Bacteroides sp. UBA939 TaxID=1946092 RepID=UPI0025C7006A|nr:DegT/DnrJ/EryC1/StrS family aminotransferase [Bacteroides sp. UBA939]
MIKYLELQRINASFEPELSAALLRVLHSGWYLYGEATERFEQEFAHFCGTPHCIGTGNGLDALTLILLAYRELGVMHEGDEVIVPANTYIAVMLSVLRAGLKPVLCEPSPDTCNIDTDRAAALITPHTRAIVPVHLYGRLADMQDVHHLAARHGLKVIEDAAQAHGAIYEKRLPGKENQPLRAGNLSDAAAFSFYPAKNLGALGDGGAVTTHDAALATIVRSIANYGSTEKYVHRYQGVNSRLDELQATALSVKLSRLDRDNARRREIARLYQENIHWESTALRSIINAGDINESNVFHVFPVFSPRRDELQRHLAAHDIQTQVHYPIPPHRQEALKQEYGIQQLPITERIHNEELSLPISPLLTNEEVGQIIDCINAFG